VSSHLINRNVCASSGRTSMRLEPELWDALEEICHRERVSLSELVRRVEQRGRRGARTSAVRVFVLDYFRRAAPPATDGRPDEPPARPSDAPRRTDACVQSAAAGAFSGPV